MYVKNGYHKFLIASEKHTSMMIRAHDL